jgi:hypothetical protein
MAAQRNGRAAEPIAAFGHGSLEAAVVKIQAMDGRSGFHGHGG